MEKVVFLDRDGTLNREVSYLHRTEEMELLPGVAHGLSRLKAAGFKLVVITNQAGVARGYYREEDVVSLHGFMNRMLEESDAGIDAFYYCPHHPEYGIGEYKRECSCRKPGIGLFLMAEQQFAVDKERSFMVGDKLLDTEAGRRYGIRSILVGTGYGAGYREKDLERAAREPGYRPGYDFFAPDLTMAAEWILEQDKRQ